MGLVKVDIQKEQRNIDADYRMETEAGVMKVLRGYRELTFRKYNGSIELVGLLADFNDAVEIAQLTDSEREAAYKTVTGTPCEEINNCALESAAKKIAGVFRGWRYDCVIAA
ncbi:hypothetical protein D1872_286530 [compost metagenome]